MNIDFEALNQIPQLLEMVAEMKIMLEKKNIQKRWLSTNEVIEYLAFGKDKIYKMVDVEFIEGEHFYRKGKTLFFDIEKLDEWVLYTPINNINKVDKKLIVNNVLSSLAS